MKISKDATKRWLRSRNATVLGAVALSPLLVANVLHLLFHRSWLPAALSFTIFVVLLVRLRATWGEMTRLFWWMGIALFLFPMILLLSEPSGEPSGPEAPNDVIFDATYAGSVRDDLVFCVPLGPIAALIGMATREVHEKRKHRKPHNFG